MDSMVCKCGGDFKPEDVMPYRPSNFVPYYDRVLRSWVSSYSDQEKKAVAHRSPSHPEGLRLVNWDRKQINEYKNIHRHKKDYNKAYYSDPEKIEKSKSGKTKYFSIAAALLLMFSTNCFALEGCDYIKFDVKGKVYDVPIPNREVRQDFILLQKALMGDYVSRTVLLGGKEHKMFFIGDIGVIRWLKLTENDVEVTERKIS